MNGNTMRTVDAVKRIEREGDANSEHCAKLLESINELAALLWEAFFADTLLPRGWKLERGQGAWPWLSRKRTGGEETRSEYANGRREGETDGVAPEWSLAAAHALARDMADGWLDEVEVQLRGRKCVALWDAGVVREIVDAMKREPRAHS